MELSRYLCLQTCILGDNNTKLLQSNMIPIIFVHILILMIHS